MLIRVNGGNSGIKEYLENGQKKDRYHSREELDYRVPLNGNLDITHNIIESMSADIERQRYLHITLSFKEDFISEEMLIDISNEFREFYFKAYNDDELNYYAEAHLPRLKSYRDAKTGEIIDRKPHIHIVVPTINLLTGSALNIYSGNTIDYIDAFQEYVNNKYGLESPKDNPRYKVNDNSEFISRYKGDGFKGKHYELRQQIFEHIINNNISSIKELTNYLTSTGYTVKVRNLGKGNEHEYLNIIGKDGVAINLRDKVFRQPYLELDAANKIASLKSEISYLEPKKLNKESEVTDDNGKQFGESGGSRSINIEQSDISAVDKNIGTAHESIKNIRSNLERNILDKRGDIGSGWRRGVALRYARIIRRGETGIRRDINEYSSNEPSIGASGRYSSKTSLVGGLLDTKYSKLLEEWDAYKAYEYKYIIASASKAERTKFSKLSVDDKVLYIQNKQAEFYLKSGVTNGRELNDELRGIRSINLKQTDSHAVNQNIRTAGDTLEDIGTNLGRSISNKAGSITGERRRRIAARYAVIIARSEAGIGQDIKQHYGDRKNYTTISETNRQLDAPVKNSVDNDYKALLTKLNLDREGYKALVVKYNEEIQADVLLELLEKTHGLNPELYRITRANDGSDRIGCGTRNLNIMDFCLKEMNLPLEESNNILANAYSMQLEVNRERGWSRDSALYLSDKYKEWFITYKAQRADSMLSHTDTFKLKRTEVIDKFSEQMAKVRADDKLPYYAKREKVSLLKIDKLLELEALKQAKYGESTSLRNKYNLEMQKAYKVFLSELAQNNDEKALLELRRLRIDYKDLNNADSFNYVARYQEYKLNITHTIDSNGVINYQHNNKTIIKDHGKRVAIVNYADENIKLTLDLAIQKFGTNISLTGSNKFRQKAVDIAIKNNYKLNFLDEISKNYYLSKLAEYRANDVKLGNGKVELLADKPQILYVKGVRELGVINSNGRFSELKAVELIDPATNKKYELSSYKINFMSKGLATGQFVEVITDSAGEISLKSSSIEKEIRKLKVDTIAAEKVSFIDKVKSDYGVEKLQSEISGKLVKTGITKGQFYALVATGKELKRVEGNELQETFTRLGISKGDTVSIAVPGTKTVSSIKIEKETSISRANKMFSDLLLEVDFLKGDKNYKRELFGRIIEVKEVKLKSGSVTNVVVMNDILTGRQQTLYMNDVSKLKVNDFSYLGEKSFNNYEVTNLNKQLGQMREKALGSDNGKDLIIGDIAKVGLKTIKGKEVYFVELRTENGIITKYGNKIREEIEQQGLKVGDSIVIATEDKVVNITKEENIYEVKQLGKNLDALVEQELEKVIDKIELAQNIKHDIEIE